jgi:hypothetical protein
MAYQNVVVDIKNGFRDLTFGQAPTPDMVLKEEGDLTFYVRPHDDLTMGNAHLDKLAYGFYHNRLDLVLLFTKGLSNSRALLDVLRQAYGSGRRPNQFMERYLWETSQVSIFYDENGLTHDAQVILESVPIAHERAADRARKAREGAKGL